MGIHPVIAGMSPIKAAFWLFAQRKLMKANVNLSILFAAELHWSLAHFYGLASLSQIHSSNFIDSMLMEGQIIISNLFVIKLRILVGKWFIERRCPKIQKAQNGNHLKLLSKDYAMGKRNEIFWLNVLIKGNRLESEQLWKIILNVFSYICKVIDHSMILKNFDLNFKI